MSRVNYERAPAPPPGFLAGGNQDFLDKTEASAPPIDDLINPPGYKNASFKASILEPPAFVDNGFDASKINRQTPSLTVLTEEDVRNALIEFVSENCCYGAKPARGLEIREIHMNSSFHYSLETFTESRETKWKFEPYRGGPVDDESCGRIPNPWEITIQPTTPFKKGYTKVEVPHSSIVKRCNHCNGDGKVQCTWCHGRGQRSCTWCSGSGSRFNERCSSCSGSGHDRCSTCWGRGEVDCSNCNGYRKIRCYIQLTVRWKNNMDDCVSDKTGLPEKRIKKAKGIVAVEERYPRLYPLLNFPDNVISQASKRLIDEHLASFQMERILEQRHKVTTVPVATVNYKWKENFGCFYVYGLEHKVCFDDYPDWCCCGVCTIL